MKKFIVLLVSMMAMFAMSVTAFASEKPDVSVKIRCIEKATGNVFKTVDTKDSFVLLDGASSYEGTSGNSKDWYVKPNTFKISNPGYKLAGAVTLTKVTSDEMTVDVNYIKTGDPIVSTDTDVAKSDAIKEAQATPYVAKPARVVVATVERTGTDKATTTAPEVNKANTGEGWFKTGNAWQYFTAGHQLKTGWLQQGTKWYYLQPGNALMQTGWQSIGNVWYFFYEDGSMASNTTVGGYTLSASGAMI